MKILVTADHVVVDFAPDFAVEGPNVVSNSRAIAYDKRQVTIVDTALPADVERGRFTYRDGVFTPIVFPPTEPEQLRADIDFLAAMGGVTL